MPPVRLCPLAAGVLLALVGCAAPGPRGVRVPIETQHRDLAELTAHLSGSFTNAAQAAADPGNYDEIELHATRIWADRTDGNWLFLERSGGGAREPERGPRVYRLTAHADGTLECAPYALPGDSRRFAGAARDAARLAGLAPGDLSLRAGCSITLRRGSDGVFSGGTRANTCASELGEATYATTQLRIAADRVLWWERGFDAAGKHVCGADQGGYEFIKRP